MTAKVARGRRPGRPPGPSQATHLRRRLIEEASQLYAEGGDAGIRFSAVAERTGLTKATVFHYFANKNALLHAVFEALGERLERAALGWFDPPPASYAARLERLVASLVDFYGSDALNARILCHGLLESKHLAPWRVAGAETPSVFGHFIRRFAAFIEAGIAAGEFYSDRPMATIMTIGGVILFEFMLPDQGRQFSGGMPLAERRREMVVQITRAVVRPRARMGQRPPARRRGSS